MGWKEINKDIRKRFVPDDNENTQINIYAEGHLQFGKLMLEKKTSQKWNG